MKISDLMKMGLRNLGRRKARTALTIVGVVIGTISIVVMFSIGIGMNTNFKKQVMELGSLTAVTVSKYQDVIDDKGNYVDFKEQALNNDLIRQIEQMEHVKTVSPVINGNVRLVANGKYECGMNVLVMDSGTFDAFDFPALSVGSYEVDEDDDIPTIWVGANVLSNYFYNPNAMRYEEVKVEPTDKIRLTIQNWEFQLEEGKRARDYEVNVAVFEQTDNWEYDGSIYMDQKQYEKLYREYMRNLKVADRKKAEKQLTDYNSIKVNVDNVNSVEKVQNAIKDLGFYSSSLTSLTKPMEETSKMLQMVLGGVGAVAMLVSAISIANTMVMSIYERTKEIGVMKVLGCLVRDIKKLFLFEAAMIGLMGGIVGITLSYAISYAINKFGAPLFEALMSGSSVGYGQEVVNTSFSIIPFWLPFLAAAFAMSVGIVSGYYPANRATKISAIEAMKSE